MFASGRELHLVSSLSEAEILIVNSEFITGIEIGFLSSFKVEVLPIPNLGLIEEIEDEE